MRLLRLGLLKTSLILLTACPLTVGWQAHADDATQDYLRLLEEVEQNRTLFDMAVTACLNEVYAEKSERANDSNLLEKCISSKGVQLNKEAAGPAMHHMGRGKNEASVFTYQIPQKEALLQRLQGNPAAAPVAAPAPASRQPESPAVAPTSTAEQQNTPTGADSQKRGSSQQKYYLPSKESGEKSKPIFLNR